MAFILFNKIPVMKMALKGLTSTCMGVIKPAANNHCADACCHNYLSMC